MKFAWSIRVCMYMYTVTVTFSREILECSVLELLEASAALGYGDSRPQRTGAAWPSAVGITASSAVTKIVDKINDSY